MNTQKAGIQHGHAPSMPFPKNTNKLKKHIAIVLDRLAKGSRLVK